MAPKVPRAPCVCFRHPPAWRLGPRASRLGQRPNGGYELWHVLGRAVVVTALAGLTAGLAVRLLRLLAAPADCPACGRPLGEPPGETRVLGG
jgi:hypothetical protein